MGLVDYIFRPRIKKLKKVSAYEEEFSVAKLKLTSASLNSLYFKTAEPASHLHQLIKAQNLASQITPKIEANNRAINLISSHAARVHKHNYSISLVPRKPASNTNRNLSNLKYIDTASQLPLNTSPNRRNTSKCKQSFQIRIGRYLAKRETHLNRANFPQIKQHSTNNPKTPTQN